jgi:hypothetical protein
MVRERVFATQGNNSLRKGAIYAELSYIRGKECKESTKSTGLIRITTTLNLICHQRASEPAWHRAELSLARCPKMEASIKPRSPWVELSSAPGNTRLVLPLKLRCANSSISICNSPQSPSLPLRWHSFVVSVDLPVPPGPQLHSVFLIVFLSICS